MPAAVGLAGTLLPCCTDANLPSNWKVIAELLGELGMSTADTLELNTLDKHRRYRIDAPAESN